MLKSLAKRIVRSRVGSALRFRLDRRLGRLRGDTVAQERFAIGILSGNDPLDLRTPGGLVNPVLTAASITNADASFVADPFLLRRDGHWYMFFEMWNRHANKGEICLAASADARVWTNQGRVLRERFHLSYPLVFEHGGECWMAPETHKANEVRLYRASRFPRRWSLHAVLLEGCFSDPTIFAHDGMWWMFVLSGADPAGGPLLLYWSPELTQGWRRHPCSPLPADPVTDSRPAGRVVQHAGRLLRFAQSCRPWYGSSVSAFEILQLTPTSYRERRVGNPLLTGSGQGWNKHGMHHIDLARDGAGWIAAVDGWSGGVGPDWREVFGSDGSAPARAGVD
jgi:hypothetical protein